MFDVRVIGLVLAAVLLAGCNTGARGVRFLDGSGSSTKPVAQPIHSLAPAEISAAIAGKTFQYTRADGNGFVTYHPDGTMEIMDDVKGAAKGTWAASGGQYCETFGEGAVQECGEFTTTGDAFFAAKSRLVEMKG